MILINRNVEAFLAVVEHKTVSEAANRLYITQTAVTQRIKALEQDVGLTLFTRSKSGMRLTSEGHIVFRCARSMKTEESLMASTLSGLGTENEVEISIAGMSSILGGRVVEQISPVLQRWPKLNVSFSSQTVKNRLTSLKTGEADFSIMFSHELIPELDHKPIKPLKYFLVACSNWKARGTREILSEETLVAYSRPDPLTEDYLKQYKLRKSTQNPPIWVDDSWTLQNQLIHGMGYSILPQEMAKPLIDQGLLIKLNRGQATEYSLCLAWYPRREFPRCLVELIDSIK